MSAKHLRPRHFLINCNYSITNSKIKAVRHNKFNYVVQYNSYLHINVIYMFHFDNYLYVGRPKTKYVYKHKPIYYMHNLI